MLGLLVNQERSGYELKDVIETRLSHFFDGTFGMIYPLLKKLEKEGLIEKNVIIQDGKPNKNMYSITAEGKAYFEGYLETNPESDVFKSDFLMRMYFAEYLEDDRLKEIIIAEIASKQNLIDQLEAEKGKWEQGWSAYQKLTYDIGIEQYKGNIAVLEAFLKNAGHE